MSMSAEAPTQLPQGAVAIECRNITKLFGGVQALANVSLTMRAGEILCLVGDNGAGKSTLSKVLTGQLRPEAGDISVNGVEQSGMTPRRALELGISVRLSRSVRI
jgi:ABC-type sugar transport system ATPase subunit